MRCLVTGASGFVASVLIPRLERRGHAVRAASRRPSDLRFGPGVQAVAAPELGAGADWSLALEGREVAIHLAARTPRRHASGSLSAFRAANRDGTRRLAEQAAASGVKRLIFISSIKAQTAATTGRDPYGRSKREAEEALKDIPGVEIVILRPPLVYGPGVTGNFQRLIRAIERGWPLPLGGATNRRSIVGVDNLSDAIRFCVETPGARGLTSAVKDPQDVSTADLLRRMGEALRRPARLTAVPAPVMKTLLTLTGARAAAERLFGDLIADDAPIRALGWRPPHTLDQQLKTIGRRPHAPLAQSACGA